MDINKNIFVSLHSIKAVLRFVQANQSCKKCRVMIHVADGCDIDGDSVMGLFSINLLAPLNVRITGEQIEIKKLLDRYDCEDISWYNP